MEALVAKPKKEGADSTAADTAATLQQILASSGVLSSLQFLPTSSDGSTQGTTSLPWMTMSPYPMMVVPQSMLTAQNIAGVAQDGSILLATTSDGQTIKLDKSALSSAGQSVAALLQKRDGTGATQTTSVMVNATNDTGLVQAEVAKATDANHLKPPKKPLTPYMTFSKMIWPQVKAANPHLSSVCELGAVVGGLWRDLDPVEKQQYNDQFTREKWAYDEELRNYLKATGLSASDLIKPKVKRSNPRDRSAAASAHIAQQASQARSAAPASNGVTANATHQLVESLLTGTQASNGVLNNAGSTGSEGWSSQAVQQLLAQMGLSGQTLYANSDGTISIDGSVLTIQGRPVQLTGQIPGLSDQTQLLTENVATSSSGWSWHQPTTTTSVQSDSGSGGMVLYQLLANGGMSADGSTVTSGASTTAQQTPGAVYYSLDAYGQIVAHESKPLVSANEGNLQQQVACLRTALEEKTHEADTLRLQLAEVYSIIERYRGGAGEQSNEAEDAHSSVGDSGSSTSTAGLSIKAE